jgi:queuine tRNA-ribosyltransferase
MAAMRDAIANGRFDDWAAETKARIITQPAAP